MFLLNKNLVLILIAIVMFSASCSQQDPISRFTGQIQNEDGVPLSHVQYQIYRNGEPVSYKVSVDDIGSNGESDDSGNFEITFPEEDFFTDSVDMRIVFTKENYHHNTLGLVWGAHLDRIVTMQRYNEPYSRDFYDRFQGSSVILREDSMFFLIDDKVAHVQLIPTFMELGKEYTFNDKGGQELKIARVNYTDMAFEITYGGHTTVGTASLNPQFHIGAEEIGPNTEDSYWAEKYYVDGQPNCLYYIAIGSEADNGMASQCNCEFYAYISLLNDCDTDKLIESTELLKWGSK